MELVHKLKEQRESEIKEAQSNQNTDTSIFLSNSTVGYTLEMNAESITSSDINKLISFRKTDTANLLYYHEIVEIFLKYGDIEYPLQLQYVMDCCPPIYKLENMDDISIVIPYNTTLYLTNSIELYFKYGTSMRHFDCGNILILDPNISNKYITFKNRTDPKMNPKMNPKIAFTYDMYKTGLMCPTVEFQFNLDFWNEFKIYETYLNPALV
jgi:hypothetical protein